MATVEKPSQIREISRRYWNDNATRGGRSSTCHHVGTHYWGKSPHRSVRSVNTINTEFQECETCFLRCDSSQTPPQETTVRRCRQETFISGTWLPTMRIRSIRLLNTSGSIVDVTSQRNDIFSRRNCLQSARICWELCNLYEHKSACEWKWQDFRFLIVGRGEFNFFLSFLKKKSSAFLLCADRKKQEIPFSSQRLAWSSDESRWLIAPPPVNHCGHNCGTIDVTI